MVDAKLYPTALTYPTLQAVSNAKLGLSKQDRFRLKLHTAIPSIIGRRASTSSPWEITVEIMTSETVLVFGKNAVDISSDALNWKAMADLVLKAHQRPGQDQTWQYLGHEGVFVPFSVADANEPTGARAATDTEIGSIMWVDAQESGDLNVMVHVVSPSPGVITGACWCMNSGMEAGIGAAMAKILTNTTDTAVTIRFPYSAIMDQSRTNGQDGSSIGATYTLTDIKGTDGLSIGNYSGGDLRVTYKVPAYNGLHQVESIRKLSAGAVYDTPSIQLDKLRKAAASSQTVTIDIDWLSDTDSFTVRSTFSDGLQVGVDCVFAIGCIANPDGVYEVDLDQANSLDVLATAAFAGVGGLVAVGTQASLEQILSESFLSTTFGQLAVTLGTTTAALISGYVSALIAAFVNNWITSDQLFDLQNHVTWVKQGAANIAMAAGAGVAVGSIPTLLSYFGVSNNVLSMAMNAVGGAATSAGIALGMASVMSKVVRHTYWGE